MARSTEAKYTIRLHDKTKKGFKAIGRALNKTRKSVFNLKSGFVSLAGIAGMGMLIKRSLDVVDKLGKVSSKLGVTSQELQQFRYAAKLAGVEQRTLDMGLQRFIRRVGEAAQNTGEAKQALKDMGITLKDSNGRILSATKLLNQVSDAFKNTADPAERLRLAFKLFDSEGVSMVNMLKDGKNSLNDVMKEAESLGIILSTEAVKGIEETNNALFSLSKFISGNFLQVVAKLAPFIKSITESIIQWGQQKIKDGGGIGSIAKTIAKQIMLAGISILRTLSKISNGFIEFGKTIESLPFMGSRPIDVIKKDIFDLENQIGLLNASVKRGTGFLDLLGIGDKSSLDTAHTQLQKLNKELQKSKTSFTNVKPTTFQNAIDVIEQLIVDLDVVEKKVTNINNGGSISGEKTIWDKMKDGFQNYKTTVEKGTLTIASITESAMQKTEDAIVKMMMGIKVNFKELARSIMADVMRMQIRKNITAPLSEMFSNSFNSPGSTHSMIDGIGVAGYEGGGFTGSGGRSGGVDGRGGFAAILHPNETVVDHTNGQSQGQTVVVNYSPQVNALDPRTAQMVIAENAQTIVGVVRQAFNRNGQQVAL